MRSTAFRAEMVSKTPLDRRAWVLQERLLSLRILYFGSQQMYWECAEAALRQDGKHYDASTDVLRVTAFKPYLDVHAVIPGHHGQTQAFKYLQWYEIVAEYTNWGLTFDSDKLPAISGIAKAFKSQIESMYIAGIWQEDFIAGLHWFVTDPSNFISHTLPSWAWASLNGHVRFARYAKEPREIYEGCCKVIDMTYQHVGLNPYGDNTGAQLRIQGQLIQVTYHPGAALEGSLFRSVWTLDGRAVGNVKFDKASQQKGYTFSCLLVQGGEHCSVTLALEPSMDPPRYYERIGYVGVQSFPLGSDGRAPFWECGPQTIVIL